MLRALGQLVRFHDDETYSVDSAKVVVRFVDGSSDEEYVQMARGAIARPLTDSELEIKLRDLRAYGGSGCDASRLIDAIWNLDRAEDVGLVVKLAAAQR
jgi:hypothetical protein